MVLLNQVCYAATLFLYETEVPLYARWSRTRRTCTYLH